MMNSNINTISSQHSISNVFASLNMPIPSSEWQAGWAESQQSMPNTIPFLRESFIIEICDRIRIPSDQKAAIVNALSFFDNEPHWKRIAWHQHRLLLSNRFPTHSTKVEYPTPDNSAEPASLYLIITLLSAVPNTYTYHAKRGIPESITTDTLNDITIRIKGFRNGHGYYGLSKPPHWMRHHFAGHLIKIGRLQYEMQSLRYAVVGFRNRQTNQVIIISEPKNQFRDDGRKADSLEGGESQNIWTAEWKEDERMICGTGMSMRGLAVKKSIILDKDKWFPIIRRDDPVWGIHIPATGRMDFDECGDSIQRAIKCLPLYFPDFAAKALTCNSWFLDTQLESYLSPMSNIIRFMKEFYLIPSAKASGRATMMRTFGNTEDINTVPHDTSLKKAVATHIEQGGHWYNGAFLMFTEDFNWGAQVYRNMAWPTEEQA